MKYALIFFLGLLLSVTRSSAQLLPPNRPEQDACGALTICGNGFFSPYSYQESGLVADMIGTDCGGGETNSLWLKLVISTSGTLIFSITPQVAADDYDFAVVDATNKDCSNLTSSDVVRCNFNQNIPVTNNGVVGLNNTATATSVFFGSTGQNFLRRIDAVAGQTYLIMINNFGVGTSGSAPSSGFTISFAGSTATFGSNALPRLGSVASTCNPVNEMIVQLTEEVKCNSIAPDGSDFQLSAGSVLSASGVNCNSSNQGYTDKVRVSFATPLSPGSYVLRAKKGTDNNTLLNLCDNALLLPDSLVFSVAPDNRVTITTDTSACGVLVYRGITYTQSTVLRDTTFSSKGCDSIYHIVNIRVIPTNPLTEKVTLSDCDSIVFRGIVYKESNSVTDTFQSYLGCDSLLRIYQIYVENFSLSVAADPVQPVKGDYVTFTTSANVTGYEVNTWLPQAVFPFQMVKEQSILIQRADTVKVIAISTLGCVDTAILYIKADSLIPVVVMPNAFSPNGDGLNDVFEPKFVNKSGYVVKDFKIYNRWGQMIYKAQGTRKAGWNGYYYNEDKKAEPGVYYYRIAVEFVDGTKETIKGDVTIVP